MRKLVLSLVVSGLVVPALQAGAQTGGEAIPPRKQVTATDAVEQPGAEVNASSVILPCMPVAAYWTGPPQSEGMPPGPELAIVSTDIRPKDARVHLDDRFVGRARYLDGTPGYLYLAPGPYRLELRLDGYETVLVDLAASAGCRYDLKHRLVKVKGLPKENKAENYGKGKPFHWVYAPVGEENGPPARESRADPGLRPDIASGRENHAPVPTGGSLRLKVTPETASVAIDGEFVATARELQRMEGPLAITSGSHLIAVSAPGFQTAERAVEVDGGEVVEVVIELARGSTQQRSD